MMICVRCYVSGWVQGVAYRAHTRRKARELGISGYARNLDDGRVEVLACGTEAAVTALREWLREGPPQARVSGVHWEVVTCEPPHGFYTE